MRNHRTVGDWMGEPLLLSEETPVEQARAAIDGHASRHACIVRDGELVGVLSDRDVLAASPGSTAGSLMTGSPETVGPEASLEAAARLLIEEDVHCLPVVSGRRVLGVITERELLRALLATLAREVAAEQAQDQLSYH